MKEKLQEKILHYRIAESRFNQLIQQRNFILQKIEEFNLTKKTLEEVSRLKGNEILVAVGSLTYINAKLTNTKKVIVEVGAGVALEKTVEEAKKTLEKREKNLKDALKKLEVEIQKTNQLLLLYQKELQRLQERSEK